MDLAQAARMIEWLDEERRRDRGMIAVMEERMVQQQELIAQLERRLNGMENEQSIMRTSFLPAERELQIAEQLRLEYQQMIEATESKRLMAEREAERRSDIGRESIARMVRDLEDRTVSLERAIEELPPRVSSGTAWRRRWRLFSSVWKTSPKSLTNRNAGSPSSKSSAARTRAVSPIFNPKSPIFKNRWMRSAPKWKLSKVWCCATKSALWMCKAAERERREEIQQFIDQQTLLLQQRDQQVAELTKSFGSYDEDMRRYVERFENWAETHRQMKKIVDDFERIGERLGRRINEVAEMQRLSEERFRQEWNDWIADDQKRWKQFTLTNDEAWRNHDKQLNHYRQHLETLQAALEPVRSSIDRMWQLERARAQLYRDRYQQLLHEYDQVERPERPVPVASSNGSE